MTCFHDTTGSAYITFLSGKEDTAIQEGMVHGKILARAPTPAQANDGGFGSVDALLTRAFGGQGQAPAVCVTICRSLCRSGMFMHLPLPGQ